MLGVEEEVFLQRKGPFRGFKARIVVDRHSGWFSAGGGGCGACCVGVGFHSIVD